MWMIVFAADASTRLRWNLTMGIVIDMEIAIVRTSGDGTGTVRTKCQMRQRSSLA